MTKLNNDLRIPNTLRESDNYYSLNDLQKKNFSQRLNYISEISKKLIDISNITHTDLVELLDEIELDILVNFSVTGATENEISIWRIHTSWTFDMRSETEKNSQLNKLLSISIYDLTLDKTKLINWINNCGQQVAQLLQAFDEASALSIAIRKLIEIDLLLSMLISICISFRLNN